MNVDEVSCFFRLLLAKSVRLCIFLTSCFACLPFVLGGEKPIDRAIDNKPRPVVQASTVKQVRPSQQEEKQVEVLEEESSDVAPGVNVLEENNVVEVPKEMSGGGAENHEDAFQTKGQKPLPTEEEQREKIKPKVTRVSSVSRQFVVSAFDVRLATSVAAMADVEKKEFFELLDEASEYKYICAINLQGLAGDPVVGLPMKMTINVVADVPVFTLNVQVGQGIDYYALRMKIAEMLLYERAFRFIEKDAIPEALQIPAWMVYGFNEAIEWKKGTADRAMYVTLFDRGEILSMEDLFKVKEPLLELDASSLGVYRASSGALVLSLLNQGGGKDAFKRMLDRAVFNDIDSSLLLKQSFPGLHVSKNSLFKWWVLQLSKMADTPLTQSYTILDSEEKLSEYLQFSYYDPKERVMTPLNLDNYKELLSLPENVRQSMVKPVIANMVKLSYRVYPEYYPIVRSYIRILESLCYVGKPLDGLEILLKETNQRREKLRLLGVRTRNYLDWYKIVSTSKSSGTFDSYIKAMKVLNEEHPKAQGPLADYLDAIEELTSHEED